MKKRLIALSLLCVALVFMFACENSNGNEDSGSLSALLFARHYNSGRRAPDWEVITIPSAYVSGNISGDPYPVIEEVRLGNKSYTGSKYFYNLEGAIHFSMDTRLWSDQMEEPKFNPLEIMVTADIGKLEGSVSVPDTIQTLSIQAGDTLALGAPLTISWSGSNADFYYVFLDYTWQEDEWTILGYSQDTMVTSNSVTFEGSRFQKDGELEWFEVVPYNGPFPEEGATPNLDGDGFGYVYFENEEISSDRMISVGAGLEFNPWSKPVGTISKQSEIPAKVHEKIRSRLGL